MRARSATEKDIPALVTFLSHVWEQMALPWKTEEQKLRERMSADSPPRITVLEDKERIIAVLGARPRETEDGPGFFLSLVAVDQGRPDRIELLDRLVLWSGRLAASEGRFIILTEGAKRDAAYGRTLLGMAAEDLGKDPKTGQVVSVTITGDVRDIIRAVLARHPDWR